MNDNLNGQHCKFFGAFGKVYSLSDENGNVFYVGCTVNSLATRLAGHISEAKSTNAGVNFPKNKIIRSLDFKISGTIVAMHWVTGSDVRSAMNQLKKFEQEWILKFRSLGYPICNRFPMPEKIQRLKELNEYVGQVYECSKETIKQIGQG
jgi:hypothetical protein